MSHVGFWMKHGKYLVFSILYSNLLLNEACKRGWSSILKGSQQGTVAVRENLKEKSLCSFLSWLWRKRRKKCWLCSCSWGLWYIQGAFFNCSSPFSVPKWKKLAQPTRSFFTLKISWKTSPGWQQLVFHFGTENRTDQLKKPPSTFIDLYFILTDLKEVHCVLSIF